MKEAFLKFVDICEKLEIDYFAHLGTALGLYRDKKFFPNDDLDVGVVCSKDKLKELFNELRSNGFRDGPVFINPGLELNHHFWSDKNVLLDVHFQFLEKENKFLENFEKVNVFDREISLPSPVEDYLELEFREVIGPRGGDWRVPSHEHSRPLHGHLQMTPKKSYKFDINEYFEFDSERFKWENLKNLYTDVTGKMELKPKGDIVK